MLTTTDTGTVLAAAAVHLDVDEDDRIVQFKTRFEAVDRARLRTGLGTLLFNSVQMFAEDYLREIQYQHGVIMAFVDESKLTDETHPEHWHGDFMRKCGFAHVPEEDEMDEDDPGIAFGKPVVVE